MISTSRGHSHALKARLWDGLVALSLAHHCLIGAVYALLYEQTRGYFNAIPVNRASVLALGTVLVLFTVAGWVILEARRHWPRRSFLLITDVMLLLLMLLPADFIRFRVLHIVDYELLCAIKRPAVAMVLAGVGLLLLWQHRRVVRGLLLALGLTSALAVVTILRVAAVGLGLQSLPAPYACPQEPARVAVDPARLRVIWIVFDEMDQRLSFDQRPAVVKLPEFDRLAACSIQASQAWTPAHCTLLSMPALISGQRIRGAHPANASDLAVTLADTGERTSWRRLPSLFAEARGSGVNTALVGWYHPYDRILGGALNEVIWYPHPIYEYVRSMSYPVALKRVVGCMVHALHRRMIYRDLCRDGIVQARRLVADPGLGLILLHLPPPHKPGIYHADDHLYAVVSMSKVAGYFNNLALADRWLGELRQEVESAQLGERTWLVVSSDHAWRESAFYDGRQDVRVPFLVHAPGMSSALSINVPLNTVVTHDLILAILQGTVKDGEGAAAWLAAHRRCEPVIMEADEEE